MKKNILSRRWKQFVGAAVIGLSVLSGFSASATSSPRDSFDFDRKRPSRGSCNDQAVELYCKVDGRLGHITAYTDCGYSNEGSFCDQVYTPGYRQKKMRVEFRCERGQWTWVLGDRGWCEVK